MCQWFDDPERGFVADFEGTKVSEESVKNPTIYQQNRDYNAN
jgi:hypothetical protein